MRVDKRMTDMLPKGVLHYAMQIPALKGVRRSVLADLGIPEEVIDYIGLTAQVRRARHQAGARGHGHRDPAAGVLRRQAVGLLGAQPRPGPVQGPLVRGRGQRPDRADHGRVERHRARRRAEDRCRRRRPAPGRPHGGEARGGQAGDRVARRDRVRLLGRPLRHRVDRRRGEEDPLRARRGRHAGQQRRALDPPLGDALDRPLPRLRAHRAAQLPRHGEADPGAAAAHEGAAVRPRRQRLLDRRADQPAALLRLRRVQGGARRVHAGGVIARRSATTSPSRRSTCRSCARR